MLWRKIRPWVPVACLMWLVPTYFAGTISIDESKSIQAILPGTATTGTVMVCQFLQDLLTTCTTGSDSDQLIFTSTGGTVTATLCSDPDGDDTVDSGCVLGTSGATAIAEGFFGGFSYTPTGGDPGFDTNLTTQNQFLFAGDPGDTPGEVPEPASFSLLVVGVLLLFAASGKSRSSVLLSCRPHR